MKFYKDLFDHVTSPENLFKAWDVFKIGKTKKPDVRRFEWNLEENIFKLRRELKNKTYQHGPYVGFYVQDPKQRHVHKAAVRDRVLHHAVFSVVSPVFEKTFIPTSFSCRIGYGTHRGVRTLHEIVRTVGRNGTRSCFVMKCDIEKFFDSVDHETLISLIRKRIKDESMTWLFESIVRSYRTPQSRERERERRAGRSEGYSHREPDLPTFR